MRIGMGEGFCLSVVWSVEWVNSLARISCCLSRKGKHIWTSPTPLFSPGHFRVSTESFQSFFPVKKRQQSLQWKGIEFRVSDVCFNHEVCIHNTNHPPSPNLSCIWMRAVALQVTLLGNLSNSLYWWFGSRSFAEGLHHIHPEQRGLSTVSTELFGISLWLVSERNSCSAALSWGSWPLQQ